MSKFKDVNLIRRILIFLALCSDLSTIANIAIVGFGLIVEKSMSGALAKLFLDQ